MYSRLKELEILKEIQYIIRSCEGINSKEGLYLIDEVNNLLKEMMIYEDESLCYAKKQKRFLQDSKRSQ